MPNINSQVNNLNKDAFQALQKVKDPNQLTKTDAKNIRSAVLKDGGIDKNEAALLQALTKDSGKVNVSAGQSATFSPSDLKFGTVKGEAKKVLETLTKPADLNKLWDQGAEGWKQIIDLSDSSPAMKEKITLFTARKLNETWQSSDITNAYKPLREAFGNAYGAIEGAGGDTLKNGRNLLYDSMKMLDKHSEGKVPDFIYNWLQAE